MLKYTQQFLLAILTAALLSAVALGQVNTSSSGGRLGNVEREELPKNIQETLAKQRIEQNRKDFEELVKRSEEAVTISEELERTFDKSQEISTTDHKKLERLEKLVRKIRSELGADGDDDDDDNPSEVKLATMRTAFKSLQSTATQLFAEVRKSTRYSISVAAIQTSNALLRLLKFIRIRK